MRKKWLMGNWKMHGSSEMTCDLLRSLKKAVLRPDVSCVVFPPSIYLSLAVTQLKDSTIHVGAQNMFPAISGAYTGEISSAMLKNVGCRYVLVGHSERRAYFKEDEKFITEKFHHAKEHDIIPVLCVGETLQERQNGLTKSVLKRQVSAVFKQPEFDFKDCIIAYEPVWAIGTGQTASPEQAEEMHAYIRETVASHNKADADRLPIIYGGSVNPSNAEKLLSMPNIDGGLVGGASLSAESFLEILKCINC